VPHAAPKELLAWGNRGQKRKGHRSEGGMMRLVERFTSRLALLVYLRQRLLHNINSYKLAPRR
jgi:hypothetical protein